MPPTTTALLAETRWLQRLAQDLVGDVHAAQDLVQDTMVAALRQPPGRVQSMRPWLKTVMQNLWHRRRRREGRRDAVERRVSRTEAQPSTAEIVERATVHRAVVDAVLQLEEPYRSTLLLRYLEDVPLQEVARRLQVPVETARTRQKRGLAMVRARLDRHYGNRSAWAAPLLGTPWVTTTTTSATTTASATAAATTSMTLGFLAVSTKAKLLFTGGTLAAAALLAWHLDVFDPHPVYDAGNPQHDPATHLDGNADVRQAVVGDGGGDSSRTAMPDNAPAARATTLIIRGVVVDEETRNPIAGARVGWHERHLRDPLEPAANETAVTDNAGRFRLQTTASKPHVYLELAVRAKGYALTTQELTETHPTPQNARPERPPESDVGEITMPPGTSVAGRVIDGSGLGVADAELVVCTSWLFRMAFDSGIGRRTPMLPRAFSVGRSGEDGHFRLTDRLVERGMGALLIAVHSRGLGFVEMKLFRKRTALTGQVIRLLPSGSLSVQVVDEKDRPIPGADILAEPRFLPLGVDSGYDVPMRRNGPLRKLLGRRTNEQGRASLRLPYLNKKAHYSLAVQVEGRPRLRHSGVRVDPKEPRSLRIKLPPLLRFVVHGRVRDRNGQPIAGAKVTADYGRRQTAVTNAAGDYRIEGLPGASTPLFVQASARGFARSERYLKLTQTEKQKHSRRVDLVLENALPLFGTVVDQHGQPVSGARVSATVSFGKIYLHARTDAGGSFRIEAAPDRPHVVRCEPPGNRWHGAVEHVASPRQSPLTLVLHQLPEAHARLRVRVEDADGKPVEPKQIHLARFQGGAPLAGLRSPTWHPATGKIGSITAADLCDGRWRLSFQTDVGHSVLEEFDVTPESDEVRLHVQQQAGGTVDGEVVLQIPENQRPEALKLSFAVDTQTARWGPVEGQPYLRQKGRGPVTLDLRRGNRFRVLDVDPGRRLVVVVDGRELKGRATVRVAAGGNARMRLEVFAAAKLELACKGSWPIDDLVFRLRLVGHVWQERIHISSLAGRQKPIPWPVHPGQLEWQVMVPSRGRSNAKGPKILTGRIQVGAGKTKRVMLDLSAYR